MCRVLSLGPVLATWGAPFQPPLSAARIHNLQTDHISLTSPPLGALPSGLQDSPIRDLQTEHMDFLLFIFNLQLSCVYLLGRSLPASILRSPIYTNSLTLDPLPRLGALPSSLHSPIPDICTHSLTLVAATTYSYALSVRLYSTARHDERALMTGDRM